MSGDGAEIIELARRLMADPSLVEDVRLAMVSADDYVRRFQERLDDRGITEPEDDLPWIALVNGLEDRGRLHELDFREAAEDIAWKIDAIAPERPRAPDEWDWLERWEDKLPHETLPAIGAHLAESGLAVLTLDMDSDGYPMTVLPADEVAECQRLAELAGYSITRWLADEGPSATPAST